MALATPGGDPIRGATITWTPLLADLPEAGPPWYSTRWEALDAATTSAIEVEPGLYEIDPPEESGTLDSVVWVTQDHHLGRSFSVGPSPAPGDLPTRTQLEPGEGIGVSVTASSGDASETTVHQGLRPETKSQSAAVLRRTYRVGADGRVTVAPFRERQWLIARRGDAQSAPCVDHPPAHCELVLRETFRVGGRIDALEPLPMSSCSVVAWSLHEDFRDVFDRVVPREDGSWGPMTLPVLPTSEYAFRLESANVVPQDVRRPVPAPGTELRIDFRPVSGISIEVTVSSIEGTPIPGARVTLQWPNDAGQQQSELRTDDTGKVTFPACPLGTIKIFADAAGYVTDTLGPLQLSEAPEHPYEITLSPAARVTGTCLFEDAPVEDFKLTYWSGSVPLMLADFYGREDGSFEIDDAPPGHLSILAYNDELARSETTTVLVGTEEPTDVTLHLRRPLDIVGTVIDASTQQPVHDARIQVLNPTDRAASSAWGPSTQVEADGSFRVKGGVPGENKLEISSPHHTTTRPSVLGTGDVVDFGYVSLFAGQPLHFRLLAEQAMDHEQCTVAMAGPVYVPPRPLDADGEAVIEGLLPGTYTVYIALATGVPLASTLYLHPGEDWSFDLVVPDHDPLVVRVLPAPGEELPSPIDVEVSYRTPEGVDVFMSMGTANGEGRIYRPPSDMATFDVYVDGRRAASRRVRPPEVREPIQIELGAPPRVFRIVDGEGQPVDGVSVRLTLPDDVSGWYSDTASDSAGEFTTEGLAHETLLASLRHGSLGASPLIPVRVGNVPPDETIEIVFDATTPLAVQLLDGAHPLVGVPVGFWDASGRALELGSPTTNADAVAVHRFVAEGTYLARVAHPGLWLTEALVEASAAPVPVQVRRLGSVVVAPTRDGAPLPGAHVTLRSLEFDADAATWAAGGRVRITPADARAGGDGAVAFEGLPRGRYAWEVDPGDGRMRRGELTVLPERRTRVALELP